MSAELLPVVNSNIQYCMLSWLHCNSVLCLYTRDNCSFLLFGLPVTSSATPTQLLVKLARVLLSVLLKIRFNRKLDLVN